MGCCRAPLPRVIRPEVTTRVSSTLSGVSSDKLRLCNHLALAGTNLPVLLRPDETLQVEIDGSTHELNALLTSLRSVCGDSAKANIIQILEIYNQAKLSGTLSIIRSRYGNARITIDFLRHFR